MEFAGITIQAASCLNRAFKNAKANDAECKLLEDLSEKTTTILDAVEACPVENPVLSNVLVELDQALKNVNSVVEECGGSNLITGIRYAATHRKMLNEAAETLRHALDQLPLGAVAVAVDTCECVHEIKEDMRQDKLIRQGETSRQTQLLKREVETLYYKVAEEMRCWTMDVLKNQSMTVEGLLQDLNLIKEYEAEARRSKDTKEQYEMEQIVNTLTESISESAVIPMNALQNLRGQMCCPICENVMEDPVMLKDSGITYDRHCITERLRSGHRTDPVTKAEIFSAELIPNIALKNLLQFFAGTSRGRSHSPTPCVARELVPGLYEGCGHFTAADDRQIRYGFLVLLLEPDGNVQGYCLINGKNDKYPQEKFIREGKWNPQSNRLEFADEDFENDCILEIRTASHQLLEVDLTGKGSPKRYSPEKSTHFEFPQLAPPHLNYCYILQPGILQMEGTIVAENGREHRNKIVLVLQGDLSLRGWIFVEATSAHESAVGYVLNGTWDDSGSVSFYLYFPVSKDERLDSASSPSAYSVKYKLVGVMSTHEDADLERIAFVGDCKQMPGTVDVENPLTGFSSCSRGKFKYMHFRVPSRPISSSNRSHMQLLRLPVEERRAVRPGFVIIGFERDLNRYALGCLEDWLLDDVFDDHTTLCMWTLCNNEGGIWRLQKAEGLCGFYMSLHRQFCQSHIPSQGYLTAVEVEDPKAGPYAIRTLLALKSSKCGFR